MKLMFLLDIPFRGDREYLHGTDMFSGIETQLSGLVSAEGSYVSSISFHRKATRSVIATLGQSEQGEHPIGRFVITTPTEQVVGSICESDTSPSRRIPYDESKILAGSTVDLKRKALIVSPNAHYTSIQTVVAGMKALCIDAISPAQVWMFGRLDLLHPLPDQMRQLQIVLARVHADKFATATLQSDNISLGSIRFIADAPSTGERK